MTPHWQAVDHPGDFVRSVLAAEAEDIPPSLIDAHPWRVRTEVPLADLSVDEAMVTSHDADPVHVARREGFVAALLAGTPLPPLIVLGHRRHLVDGYARLRALRLLGVPAATVVEQATDTP